MAFQHSVTDSNFCLWEHGGNIVHHISPRKCYLTEITRGNKWQFLIDNMEKNLLEEGKHGRFFHPVLKLYQKSFYLH